MSQSRQPYTGYFGSVQLTKAFCPSCHRYAIVGDSQLNCCGVVIKVEATTEKRESTAEPKRRLPRRQDRQRQLLTQDYRCFYCEKSFDSYTYRKGTPVKLRIEWDHAVPFAYSQDNRASNFVASCQICNNIKSSSLFSNINEARLYIQAKRTKKGYRDGTADDQLQAMSKGVPTEAGDGNILLRPLPNSTQHGEHHSVIDSPQHDDGIGSLDSASVKSNHNQKESTAGRDEGSHDLRTVTALPRRGYKRGKHTMIPSAPTQVDEELRQWLAAYLVSNSNIHIARQAKTIGVSRTALEYYIAGTYFKPKSEGGMGVLNSKIEGKIRAFRESGNPSLNASNQIVFVEQIVSVKSGSNVRYLFRNELGVDIAVIELNTGTSGKPAVSLQVMR